MNVNGVNANNNLIDASSINKVSADIFAALQNKTVNYSEKTLSKFQRQTLGLDFYNQRTDLNIQREASIANSGAFQQVNLRAVQALNAFAAQQLYAGSIQEEIGGKMTIDTPDTDYEFVSEVEDVQNLINVFETEPDKKGSNPFSFEAYSSNNTNEEA